MKKLFLLVYLLTIFDAAATAAGVKLGVIEEANPLICRIMTCHPVLSAVSLSAVIGAALYVIYKVRNRVHWLAYAMCGVLVVKIWVIYLHINWITQVI